jgi:hypothetical protein
MRISRLIVLFVGAVALATVLVVVPGASGASAEMCRCWAGDRCISTTECWIKPVR